eukprot:TRINITY_DN2786_c0_g2_i12.p1 TRINITY_DN2786_c0_g2~~TRINITY_DN2786_c0_g2_i12.p1  ORF type:complete len:230 (+),score=-17.62 TRINITY_DN2786_c0_g2_i12:566-1255(+)
MNTYNILLQIIQQFCKIVVKPLKLTLGRVPNRLFFYLVRSFVKFSQHSLIFAVGCVQNRQLFLSVHITSLLIIVTQNGQRDLVYLNSLKFFQLQKYDTISKKTSPKHLTAFFNLEILIYKSPANFVVISQKNIYFYVRFLISQNSTHLGAFLIWKCQFTNFLQNLPDAFYNLSHTDPFRCIVILTITQQYQFIVILTIIQQYQWQSIVFISPNYPARCSQQQQQQQQQY